MNTKKKGLTSFLSTLHGGGEGSRTPVQKSLNIAFSGCSPFLLFPLKTASGQAVDNGSFFIHDLFKSKQEVHVHHYMTLQPKP